MRKLRTLMLITVLVLSTLVMIGSAFAQSVPEFTLKYIDLSYNVPPTYGTDPYTGKTIITQDSYHIDNRSLQFTINNQPFTPYTDLNGNHIDLYYNFRIKGAYGTEWDYYPFAPNGYTTRRYGGFGGFGSNSTESPADLVQSNSEYTTITIQIPGVYRVPAEAKLEVQAQALIGHMEPTDYNMIGMHVYVFTGRYGDWGNTQTLTIGEIQTPSPKPTSTPEPILISDPNFFLYTGLALLITILVVFAVFLLYFKKRKH